MKPLFELGQVVATPGVLEELDRASANALVLLRRHILRGNRL